MMWIATAVASAGVVAVYDDDRILLMMVNEEGGYLLRWY